MSIERATRFGRRHAAFATNQEALVELGFERGYLLAQCRLRNMKYVGGSRETTRVDDLNERPKAPCINQYNPLIYANGL